MAAAVGRGWSNARISRELLLSLSTVKTYLSSALSKLDLDNRTQLALLAHDAGLSSARTGTTADQPSSPRRPLPVR